MKLEFNGFDCKVFYQHQKWNNQETIIEITIVKIRMPKKKKNRTTNEQREKNICTKHMHGNDADTKKEIDFKKIW